MNSTQKKPIKSDVNTEHFYLTEEEKQQITSMPVSHVGRLDKFVVNFTLFVLYLSWENMVTLKTLRSQFQYGV